MGRHSCHACLSAWVNPHNNPHKVEERTNSTTLSSDLHLCAYPHNNNRICSQIWSFLLRLSVWIKSNHLFVLIYFFSKTSGPMATLTMLEFCWESKWKYNQDKMGSWEVMLFYWSQESLVMKVSFRWLLEQSTWVLFVIVSLPTSPLCPQLGPLSISAEKQTLWYSI